MTKIECWLRDSMDMVLHASDEQLLKAYVAIGDKIDFGSPEVRASYDHFEETLVEGDTLTGMIFELFELPIRHETKVNLARFTLVCVQLHVRGFEV
jgi:hypothetical protein